MTPDPEFESNLGSLVGQTAKAMSRALMDKFRAAGFEVGMDPWMVLVHLWHEDGLNQQTLGEVAGRNKTTVTRAINWLETQNMVVRVPDQNDRRIKRIFLTHQGRQMRYNLQPYMREVLQEATEGIPEPEVQVCKAVLGQVFRNLKQYI